MNHILVGFKLIPIFLDPSKYHLGAIFGAYPGFTIMAFCYNVWKKDRAVCCIYALLHCLASDVSGFSKAIQKIRSHLDNHAGLAKKVHLHL